MKILIIIYLIIFTSCKQIENVVVDTTVRDLVLFEALLKANILDAHKVIILENDDINSGKFIVHPPNAWIPLVEFHNFQKKTCLIYKVPFSLNSKDQLGTLALFDLPVAGGCLDQIAQGPIAIIDKVYNLSYALSDEEQRHSIFPQKVSGFHLAVRFDREEKEKFILIPLPNLKHGTLFFGPSMLSEEKNPVKYSKRGRFESSASSGLASGFNIINANSKLKLLGNLNDNYREKSAIICHDVDENCRDVANFECHKCKYGWYETVRSQCEQGGPKFCGINHCGERAQPACPIGSKVIKDTQACYSGSKAGYCSPGLNTVCDENKILICL